MNLDEMEILLRSEPDRPLELLEGDIWRAVAARQVAAKRLRGLAIGQAVLAAVTILGSAALGGMLATQAMARPSALSVFSPHMDLAPSSRLAGHGR